jgi:hypothetical protein
MIKDRPNRLTMPERKHAAEGGCRHRRVKTAAETAACRESDGRYLSLLISRNRNLASNLPRLWARQQARHAMARLMRRTRGKSFLQCGHL